MKTCPSIFQKGIELVLSNVKNDSESKMKTLLTDENFFNGIFSLQTGSHHVNNIYIKFQYGI